MIMVVAMFLERFAEWIHAAVAGHLHSDGKHQPDDGSGVHVAFADDADDLRPRIIVDHLENLHQTFEESGRDNADVAERMRGTVFGMSEQPPDQVEMQRLIHGLFESEFVICHDTTSGTTGVPGTGKYAS